MSTKLRTFSIPLVVAIGIALAGCEEDPPDPNGDPPPGFNFRYVLELESSIVYPYAGSNLGGQWLVDYYSGGFTPYGYVRWFNPMAVTFGTWYSIPEGRWPALWNFYQTSGACMGKSTNTVVDTKNITLACVPVDTPGQIVPVIYNGAYPPPIISLYVNPVDIPVGSPMTGWVVRDDGYIGLYQQTSVGSNGQTDLPAPTLWDGAYQVVGNFTTQPNGYEYAAVPLDIYGNPGAVQPTGLYISPNSVSQGECFGIGVEGGESMAVDIEYSTPGGDTETLYGLQLDEYGGAVMCTDYQTDIGVYEFLAVRNVMYPVNSWVEVSDYVEVWPGF